MSYIESVNFREVIRPLKVNFATSLGSKDVIRSILVRVRLNSGLSGTGECPTSFSLKHETVETIKKILTTASQSLINMHASEYESAIRTLRIKYPHNPMTISGLETALFRVHLADMGKSEYDYWGGAAEVIETDITIPFIKDAQILDRWVDYTVKTGFSIFKLKVSGNVEADKIYISRVYERLKIHEAGFAVRLDGNQGYTENTFFQLIDFLIKKDYVVELFEQPLHRTDYDGYRKVKKRSPLPIVLDETVFTIQDLTRCIEEDLCHGVNIKIAKSGIGESMKIYSTAKIYGIRLMIGCMTETMKGLSAGIYFALGTGSFDYIDLDAIHLIRHRKQYGDIRIEGPMYVLAHNS